MTERSSTRKEERARCTGSDVAARGSISLPVVDTDHKPGGTIRQSKNGKRRAIVLVLVQGVLIVHIVAWSLGLFGAKTISPIEPSESMEFVKTGIINAGLVFFAIALLATLILGRWFCGWGCHVVLLQDWCGWMMKKMGIRPKPFRSRLLIYVPFLLALYMFIWPAAYRWGLIPLDKVMADSLGAEHWLVETERTAFGVFGVPLPRQSIEPWQAQLHLTTEEFWRTFPGVMVAIPFLLICGFATVYFLGAKGFCTYGCPYGGFFAPLDKYALGSIRVTDACEQCGHCTAVCTSNVRVHDEVREYGMVVDQGCMKCLDCVSVCPNDALYFGFGKPSVLKGPAKNEKPKKKYDMSWGEEIGIASVFALVFFSVRGVYEVIPFLMAAGVAGVTAFMVWKLWRMLRDANVNFHRYRLKSRGSIGRSGWVFAAITVFVLVVTAHSGMVNLAHAIGNRSDEQVQFPAHLVFAEARIEMPDAMKAHAERAVKYLTMASSIEDGGIGLMSTWQSKIDFRLAWLTSALGRFDEAQRYMERVIARDGMNETTASWLFRIYFVSGQREANFAHLLQLADEHPDYLSALAEGMQWLLHEGENDLAVEITEKASERQPNSLAALRLQAWAKVATGRTDEGLTEAMRSTMIPLAEEPNHGQFMPEPLDVEFIFNTAVELIQQERVEDGLNLARAAYAQRPTNLSVMRRLSFLEVQVGDLHEGIALIRQTLEIDPSSPHGHYYLAVALAHDNQLAEAYPPMKTAIELSEGTAPGLWYMQMSEICAALNKTEEAQQYAAEGEKRQQ